jgi:tetratricopeptide (TPR) repeat protein
VIVDRAVRQLQRERGDRRTKYVLDAESIAVIAKGLLLHTDIAIAERTSVTTGTPDAVLVDAKAHTSRRFSLHWSHARMLVDALGRNQADTRDEIATPSITIARAWYRAVGALFQAWGDLGHLGAHLGDGERVLGDDPVLLLYQGSLHQGYADARLQTYLMELRKSIRGLPEGPLGPYQPIGRGRRLPFDSAYAELESAESALRRALALDPSLVEARIRLAHVLDSRGKPEEGAVLARQALAEPLRPFLEYYGAMVLGRCETRAGHHAEARAAFERAAARYPRSRTAHVALSYLALSGSPGMAAEALVQALGPDALDDVEDPWAWYFRRHEPDAQALLAMLRASVP